MRAILVILVLAVLGYAAYEYGYRGEPPPRTVEEATGQAREALRSASESLGPAAQQAADAVRQGAEQLKAGAQQLGQETRQAVGEARTEAAADDPEELGGDVREAVGRARAALVGVADAPAAETAASTVRDVNERLGQLQGRLDALSADARRGLAGVAAEALPGVREMAERVKAIQGTGPGVDDALDAMIARLEAWARPPA